MRLDIRKNGGRVLVLEHGEDFCRNCKVKRGDKRTTWFYFDNKYSKGLYCKDCAVEGDVFINDDTLEPQNYFWLVDEWEYLNKV